MSPRSKLILPIALVLVVVACSSSASPSPIVPTQSPQASGSPEPTASASGVPPASPAVSPTSEPPPAATGSIPVRGSAQDHASTIAAGPDGLFVLISRLDFTTESGSDDAVLALLDDDGSPRPGWPVRLPEVEFCWMLLPVDDGSVRVVCQPAGEGYVRGPSIAFAFDPDGRPMAGWPVELPIMCCDPGRIVGTTLIALAGNGEVDDRWITSVTADGAVTEGVKVPGANRGDVRWSIGPDGVAYGSLSIYGDSVEDPKSGSLFAIGVDGERPGFGITIDGLVSAPSFDEHGLLYITHNVGPDRVAGVLTVTTDGSNITSLGSIDVPASDACVGIEGSCETPAAPLVGSDGAAFVVGSTYPGTVVAGISPTGGTLAGWPYRTDSWRQGINIHCDTVDCDGFAIAMPAIGPGDVVYLPLGADTDGTGGTLTAIGADGRELVGWPVELSRPGSGFWSVEVGTNGTVYALAVEPEAGDGNSATVLAIDPDSTVIYATTLVEP